MAFNGMKMSSLDLLMLILLSLLAILVYEFVKVWAERNALRSRMEQIATEYANELFERWREEEMEYQKRQIEEVLRREMNLKVKEYLRQKEAEIREDAIKRHEAVVTGKVTEHLIPYLPEFRYNPKDARFIGSPVDFVVFDGLSEGSLRRIVFVEVKAGKRPRLNEREKQVRDIVEKRKVYWEMIHKRL